MHTRISKIHSATPSGIAASIRPMSRIKHGGLILAGAALCALGACDKSSDGENTAGGASTPADKPATDHTEKPTAKKPTGDDAADKKPKAELSDTPIERRLHSERIEASSFLWTDWNRFQENYHPNYITDGDPVTAWVEGAQNSGAGSWIRLHVSPVEGATKVRLRLRNGYHKSKSLFEKNARAKDVTIATLPGNHEHTATLTDVMDWQEVAFDHPESKIEAIQITVDSVYEGKKYTDLCLSDAEVFVTGLTKDNPAFEKAKLDKILAWKAARIAIAESFKSGKAKRLPIGAAYRVTTEKKRRSDDSTPDLSTHLEAAAGEMPGAKSIIARAQTAVASKFKGWAPVDHAIADERSIPEVDGLYFPYPDELPNYWAREDAFMLPVIDDASLLTGVGLSLFGAKRDFGPDGPEKCPAGKTFMWRPPQDKGPQMSQLLLVHCAVIEERDGQYVEPIQQLLGFDDHGRLALLASMQGVELFSWEESGDGARITGGTRVANNEVYRLTRKTN